LQNVTELKHFGTRVTSQNYIQEEIKSTLNSGNACYHSVQSLLFFLSPAGKCEDWNVQNCNLTGCFVRVWNCLSLEGKI